MRLTQSVRVCILSELTPKLQLTDFKSRIDGLLSGHQSAETVVVCIIRSVHAGVIKEEEVSHS